MSTIRRDYFPVYNEIGSLLDNFFKGQQLDASFVDTSSWAPPVDIKEEKDRFLVLADIPGVNREDIQISLEHNVLTLRGERHFEKTEKKEGYTRIERSQGQFYRRFSLPQTADDAKISAKYKQGVLEISIPKKQTAVQKKIDITVEE
ncbi:heat shock protein, Hsp20 family [Legionella sainthelensi]|uniref:Heat shock protein, Hsp20 family n=1 Tax=Legionella sainthelensi TaxID=28087 RepID=A0A0W0YPW2_9GAMM|nr:Hsp20/alpha crystallin family protein [Legionella sainthelensi]KTD58909.1 heat shock protein, Hsp20 family [Legionella sainthelensi]